MARLRHANPDASRPILVLDLDGIDEVNHEQRCAVQRLLHQFWRVRGGEATDAVLLVTARGPGGTSEAAMDKLVRRWLTSDLYSRVSAQVGRVFVTDFGEEELSNAARLLGQDCWRRIAPALAASARGGIGPTALGDESLLSGDSPAAAPAMVNSLRHPAMWGSFVSLDHDRRLLVLDQQSAALSELTGRFILRFCEKVNRRHTSLLDKRVWDALRAICTAIPRGSDELSRRDHWIAPARGPVNDDEAACLFDEAISYGLIIENARGQWLWRHPFVPDHLKGD